VLSIAVLALALMLRPAGVAASCFSDWRECADKAYRAFFRNEVGEIRHAAALQACTDTYDACEDKKEREDGK